MQLINTLKSLTADRAAAAAAAAQKRRDAAEAAYLKLVVASVDGTADDAERAEKIIAAANRTIDDLERDAAALEQFRQDQAIAARLPEYRAARDVANARVEAARKELAAAEPALDIARNALATPHEAADRVAKALIGRPWLATLT